MLQTLLLRRKPKSWCIEEEISLREKDFFFPVDAFLTICMTKLQLLLLYTVPNENGELLYKSPEKRSGL